MTIYILELNILPTTIYKTFSRYVPKILHNHRHNPDIIKLVLRKGNAKFLTLEFRTIALESVPFSNGVNYRCRCFRLSSLVCLVIKYI